MNNCGWKTPCVFLPSFFILHYSLFILHSPTALALVGLDGLEPSTSRLSGARSNHLSYKPLLLCWFFPSYPCLSLFRLEFRLFSPSGMNFGVSSELPRVMAPDTVRLVEMMGFEPMTPCLQGRCSPNWATPPYHGFLFFSRIVPVPENWTTKDLYPAFCVPTSSWLVWQNRDILSRSP